MENDRRFVPRNLEGVPRSKPIEIFSQVKKTPLMLEVEQVTNEGLREFLEINYSVENLSTVEISRMIRDKSDGHIQITRSSISNWLKSFNIPTRSTSEGTKLVWQNPEKRESIIEKIHSPGSNKKRSETMRRNWQSYSELEKENRLRAAIEGTRAAVLKRIREKLGEDPTKRIKEMHSRLSPKEIGEELKIFPSTVQEWMKNLGIETTKPRRRRGSINVNKEEKQNLVTQARAKGLIEMLPEKYQVVINARFPTEGTTAPLTQIGQKLDPNRPVKLSREYVRQIQERALGKLANELNKVGSFD